MAVWYGSGGGLIRGIVPMAIYGHITVRLYTCGMSGFACCSSASAGEV